MRIIVVNDHGKITVKIYLSTPLIIAAVTMGIGAVPMLV
jgi:hypothetical protein